MKVFLHREKKTPPRINSSQKGQANSSTERAEFFFVIKFGIVLSYWS